VAVIDAQRASFNGVDFYRYLVEFKDTFGPGFHAHRIPGRAGAKQEELGPSLHQMPVKLEFSGVEWRTQVQDVLGAMIAKPRGLLVHPVYGKRRAVLKAPINATFNPSQRGCWYGVDLLFEEDTLDQALQTDKGPAAHAQDVQTHAAEATTAAEAFRALVFAKNQFGAQAQALRQRVTDAVGLVAQFVAQAREFADTAISNFDTGSLAPLLDSQLARLPRTYERAAVALQGVSPVASYDSRVAMEMTLKSSTDLNASLRANLPPPTVISIREKGTLAALVGRIYPGRDYAARVELYAQIARTNHLARPDLLVPGMSLTVPAP